jgi:hypothetical protein
MLPNMRPLRILAPLALAAVLAGGCATPSTTSDGNSSSEKEPVRIEIGMSAEEVRAQLGKPAAIEGLEPGGAEGEVWVYKRTITLTPEMVATGTVNVPMYDPLTQSFRERPELIMKLETRTVNEEVRFVFVEGLLVRIQRTVDDPHVSYQ